jgi:hypothetical protein
MTTAKKGCATAPASRTVNPVDPREREVPA